LTYQAASSPATTIRPSLLAMTTQLNSTPPAEIAALLFFQA